MAERETEFELKFTGSMRDVAALPRSLVVSALCGGAGEWERLSTTYYDTPNGVLRRAGFSLRLREEGGGLVQAVKSVRDGGAGVVRDEIETALAHSREFPGATGDDPVDRLIAEAADVLTPVASTITDRWTRLVRFRSSKIELGIDIGRAESWVESGAERGDGERRVFEGALAEVELELKDGAAEDIFDLGRLLARNTSLRLCARNKLERARALSMGGPYRIEEPAKGTADPDESAADLLQRALGSMAARLADMQPVIIEARRPEGVHQMRVALRRLRAVERVFRPHLKSGELALLAERAKLFGRALAPARDWDVFVGETLPAAFGSACAPTDHARLKAEVEAVRAAAWADVVGTIGGPDFTVFLIDLMQAAVLARWREKAKKRLFSPVKNYAPRALHRVLKKTAAIAATARIDRPEELHRLRVALKKLRYPVQLFRSLYPKEQRRAYMARLSVLQEAFGAVNDALVAQRLANSAAAGKGDAAMRAAGFVCGYKAAEAEAAAETIRKTWREFAEMKVFWRD